MTTNTDATPTRVDFDLTSMTTRRASDEALEEVKATGCPVVWTEDNGGHWIVGTYDLVASAFRDWETFSSERRDPGRSAIAFTNSSLPPCLPEESDPPHWYGYRRALATILSPQASERLRGRARHWANYALDRVVESGTIEFVHDLTTVVPARVTLEWLGYPEDEWQWFADTFHGISAYPAGSPEHHEASKAYGPVLARINEELHDRIVTPREDALTAIAHHEVDGVRLTEDAAQSIAFLTTVGGIDTTTALAGGALLHLSQHADDRQRLIDQPDLLPLATEEFLRFYPPARAHKRIVAADTDFGGVTMKAGDEVLLSEVAAGRDETEFPDADRFVIDRNPNRHVSFGVGIHRCPGSHLARITFSEMITAVLQRIPDYGIDLDDVVDYPDWAMVGGWQRMPATFTPSRARADRSPVDLSLTDEQEQLVESFRAFLVKESPPTVVRDAEERGGFDRDLWSAVGALGGPGMGVDLRAGGAGAGLLDLELVAERFGAALAPVPVIDAWVAARVLADAGEAASELLDRLLDERPEVATLALQPAHDGVARLVPAGAVATVVVGLDGEELVAVDDANSGTRPVHNLGGEPLADRSLRGGTRTVLARGGAAAERHERAVDEWRVLTAGALVGLAGAALELGVEYAKQRHQFGVPIGSFQAVAHQLADAATMVDGAQLLAREAAWAADEREPDTSALARMAFVFATRAAQRTTSVALHVHGGYGFTLEYDVQLYHRRAKAWPLALGDPRRQTLHLADALFGPGGIGLMEFRLGAKSDTFRDEVRAFLREHVPPDMVERAHDTGTNHNWDLHRALGEAGWIAASWPEEYGGQGRDPFEMTAMRDELRLASVPTDGLGQSIIVARTIRAVGTEEQKQQFIPPFLKGELIFALGYTEPDSGSDVAAAKTRAVRDGDDWVIDGQKMFTTLAHEAAYVFLLTRTNPDVPKHRGLTMFLVPLDAPGVEIHPVHTMGGERTNATFYSDVRVPDAYRVGDVDGGWDVMTVALTFERGGFALSEADRVWGQTVDWASTARRPDGTRVIDDPLVRERLATMRVDNEVARLLALRCSYVAATGGMPGVEGSMHKLWYAEAMTANAAELVDMLGAEGVLAHGAAGAPVDGWVEHLHRHAAVTTIYGGTSEVQRDIIASRGLGLPRSRR